MTVWRSASAADAVALRDLERDASLAGLGHVFGELPYPEDDVLARWVLVLSDPEVRVEVVEDEEGLVAFTAYDADSLRHLGVRPDHWGTGLGRAGVARAVAAGVRTLWVLEDNVRGRGLYDSLGWAPTGVTQECPWAPYPIELQYAAPSD